MPVTAASISTLHRDLAQPDANLCRHYGRVLAELVGRLRDPNRGTGHAAPVAGLLATKGPEVARLLGEFADVLEAGC